MEENLPPGFRFHPTDEELITYYLTNKVSDFSFTSRAIADVDINKCEPWDLPGKASMGEKEWYFFNLRDRKYPTGLRTNRATEAGYWKTTGKDKEIFRGGVLVGMKKTLVFYRGRAPKGEKTNWVMHEYRLEPKLAYNPSKEEWVVCRVFQKSITVKRPQQTSSSPQSMESPCDTNTLLNDLVDINELQNASEIIGNPLNVLTNNFCLQSFSNEHINLNWGAPTDPSTALASLSWPSNFLNPNNLSMNTLLLRALQLRNYQQREVNINNNSSFLAQGIDNTEFPSFAASSSRVLDQSYQQQAEEQPFNLDSGIW